MGAKLGQRSRQPSSVPEEPKGLVRWLGYLLLTLLLGVMIAVYVQIGRDSNLAGTLPLPKALQTHSAAHEDLMLFGRALNELAVEAERRLPEAPDVAHPIAPRLLEHVQHLHEVGRDLEPKVSREETRVLMALQQGEGLLRAFIEGQGTPPFDTALIQQVKDQIQLGLELGRGRQIDQIILGKKQHLMAQEVSDQKKKRKKPEIDPFHPPALTLPMNGEEE